MSDTVRPRAKSDSLQSRARQFPAVEVAVLAKIIEKAIRQDSSHCMIGEQLKEMFPGCRPSVDLATISYTDRAKGLRATFLTPSVAQNALIRFDRGEPVESFTFRLARPILLRRFQGNRRKKVLGDPTVDRPSSRPSQRREGVQPFSSANSGVSILGGPPLPNGPLATTKGRIRRFGLKQTGR